jgi:hypothetical protein
MPDLSLQILRDVFGYERFRGHQPVHGIISPSPRLEYGNA